MITYEITAIADLQKNILHLHGNHHTYKISFNDDIGELVETNRSKEINNALFPDKHSYTGTDYISSEYHSECKDYGLQMKTIALDIPEKEHSAFTIENIVRICKEETNEGILCIVTKKWGIEPLTTYVKLITGKTEDLGIQDLVMGSQLQFFDTNI